MRYRKLDADGDYVFGHGQADFYRDVPEAVAQSVWTRLRLWQGEWFLDTDDGVPYLTDVLGKYTKDKYDATIKARILGTTGVASIDSYNSVFDGETRLLTITAAISTIYGATTIQGNL